MLAWLRRRRLLRLRAVVEGETLSRGGWYECARPRGCGWSWRYDGGDDWYGPRYEDGYRGDDMTCARKTTTQHLHDGNSDCFGKLVYVGHDLRKP